MTKDADPNTHRFLAEMIPQQVWTARPDGNLDFVNTQVVEYFRCTEVEILGQGWQRLLHPDDLPRCLTVWQHSLRTGEDYEIEFRLRRADGTYRWHLGRARLQRDADGRPRRWFGANTDIDDQKRADQERVRLLERAKAARAEAEAANRAKDEFLATLSHELRTPLLAMLGWSQLLRSGRLGDDQKARALETIERSARQQAQMIDDVLDVSRIIAGKLRVAFAPLNIADIIEASANAVRPLAASKGVRLEVESDRATGGVLGDADRLHQVLWNLLNNAIKFTPSGGRVKVRNDRGLDAARIQVCDTGAGIPAPFLPRVFDRFSQADGSSTRIHSGLGLGLSIVRHIVELHGGTVAVESEGVGRGASFTVYLPALVSCSEDSSGIAEAPRAAAERTSSLAGLRVLVVDDQEDARELLTVVLSGRCAHVRQAGSVREALEVLAGDQVDLLVSDIGMPGEDGYALMGQLHRLAIAGKISLPISVALTGFASEEDSERILSAGFSIHIPKPIDPDRLIQSILLAVRGNAQHAENGQAP